MIFHFPADPDDEPRRAPLPLRPFRIRVSEKAARDLGRRRFDSDLALFPRRTTKFLFSLTKLQLVRVRDSSSTVPIDVPVLRGITETLGAKLALNSRSFQFAETPNNRRLKTRVRKREKDWLGDGANRDEKEHEQTNLPHLLFVIPTSD